MQGEQAGIFYNLFFILLLIFINAFFAASEVSIISINRSKIIYLANEGNKKAMLILKLLKEPSRFLATIQVGITLAGFLVSASSAVTISENFADILRNLNIGFITAASGQIALFTTTILLSFVTLVLGELLPKRFAMQNAEKVAMNTVKSIVLFSKVASPFIRVLTFSTGIFGKMLGMNVKKVEEKVTEDEIRMMIDVGEENGVLNETEKEMIDGIFEFDNTLAREVMTPRTKIFAIDIEMPIEDVIDTVLEEQYSRVPVYEEDIDNIIGILYMKDLFIKLRNSSIENISIMGLLRPAYFVPETKNIDTLFRELQHSKNHMAMLIDEYGGLSGIVTIEDLIEEIVGNISDEYDEDGKEIQRIDNNTFLVSGLVSINDINQHLDIDLPTDISDTVGGFVLSLIGDIPKENTEYVVDFKNINFKVEEVSEKRIEQIKITINTEGTAT